MITKKCTGCKTEKELSDFQKGEGLYGTRSKCKKCLSEHKKKYRLRNIERVKRTLDLWRKKNKEKINANRRIWYQENKEQQIKETKEWRLKLRGDVLRAYGAKCACCGEISVEFLVIDHINGGGNKERKRLKLNGGSSFYQYLRKNKFPEGYRVLCHNCNSAKGLYGYCPHERKNAN